MPLDLTDLPEDLAEGLVYRYRTAPEGPRTHVLIVGVGAYPWSELPELSSPAVSARAMADWFLNYPPEGGKAQAKADRAAANAGAPYRGIPTRRQTRKAIWSSSLVFHP